jgi:aryl-alcohol dehydrogenase-like predicted oxidoreductase
VVDVRELEKTGLSLENALAAAAQKDSGLTAAQLAWVLSQIKLGEDVTPPGRVTAAELREYIDDLTARLTRFAFPK